MTCYVYLFDSEAPVLEHWPGVRDWHSVFKVGISTNPAGRLATLKTSCPFALRAIKNWKLDDRACASLIEQRYHTQNQMRRVNGEWFYGDVIGALQEIESLILHWAVDDINMPVQELMPWLSEVFNTYNDHVMDVIRSDYGESLFQ